MLTLLRIRNLALAESVEIELGTGLNVITGETGSGKTILLEAIGLLFGERAQPSSVRTGAERAAVEAVLETGGLPPIQEWLEGQFLATADPGELIIRREILLKGRSRAWINGKLVTVNQLAELGELLADVHVQHQGQKLTLPARQREVFDAVGKHEKQRDTVATAYRQYTEVLTQYESLENDDRSWRQRLDFLEFQIHEIEDLGLQPDEVEELKTERERLAHADQLQQHAAHATHLLSEGEGELICAIDLLGQVQQVLGKMTAIDSSLESSEQLIDGAVAQIEELTREMEKYAANLDHDPERLEEIESRLEAIHRLERKHGAGIPHILNVLKDMKEEAHQLANRDTEREALEKELQTRSKELIAAAAKLSAIRQTSRALFCRQLKTSLKELSLPHAQFEVRLRPWQSNGIEVLNDKDERIRICAEGAEQVEFLFSANPGEDIQPLQQVASGGELSRVLLALHTITAEKERIPIQVFDEIDAGLSGQAAVKVANALCSLARTHQVICVTHQPTIASRATAHFLVEKKTTKGRTTTSVSLVRESQRQLELARLLDGATSSKSLELAGEMMKIPA